MLRQMVRSARVKFHALLRAARREPPIVGGGFDLTTLPALLQTDSPVILDIGCNDGAHTLEFLKLFPASKVYAFEPDPRAISRFRELVQNERARLYPIALSAQDGTAEFYVSSGTPPDYWPEQVAHEWDYSGSIRKPKNHHKLYDWIKFEDTIKVQTKRLDAWLEEEHVDLIDFIWADVQGAEEDLIVGGMDALQRTRYLYTEYSDRELYEGGINLRAILKLLPDFEVVARYSHDVLLRNKLLFK